MAEPSRSRNLIPLAAVILFTAYGLFQAIGLNLQPDFFIYRLGAELGLRGESPYNIALIRSRVAEQFPDPDAGPDSFVNNCGFFLPPMAVMVYTPFAMLPWPAAKIAWIIVSAIAAFAITRITELFQASDASRNPVSKAETGFQRSPIWDGLVPFLLVVNFLSLSIVQVGQSTLLAVGCIALGQWCFEKGRPSLGVVLWSVAFIKPHVALPLLPLAWCLGGWKRAASLLGVVVAMNLIGAMIIGGSPLVIRDYLDFLGSGHKAVAFNLVERNFEITSWNRLLFVTTGHLIEQKASTTLAGYLIWFGLVVGRCALAGTKPSPAWATAAAAVGAAWCPQVLAYEVLILAFAVPWMKELFTSGERLRGIAVAVVLAIQLVPFDAASAVGIEFHRPLGVAMVAVLTLIGPVAPRSAPQTPRRG